MPVLTLIDAKIVLEETKMMDKDSFICLCLSSVHRFWRLNNNFVPAFGAYIGFAGGAGKAVAARTIQLGFIPRFSAVGAGYLIFIFLHIPIYLEGRSTKINFTKPNKTTCVKIMVAPEGISAKYEISKPIKEARKANPTE